MADITHRTIDTNGITLRIAEAGSGPLVVLVHGFPESWYSWRHQLPALADAGFHAVAPDVRGYGGSDKPEPIEAYSMTNIAADIAGLVQALGEETAVAVGHDWGAPIAYASAMLHPDRFRAVAGLSVPWSGRAPMKPTELFKLAFPNNFFYITYFQKPGVAEAELEADVARSMRLFLYAGSGDAPQDDTSFMTKPADSTFLAGLREPEALPAWLTQADLDYFTGEFTKSGFRGPLNRYRNMDRDWEEIPQFQGMKIQQPAMFLAGARDAVIKMQPFAIDTMRENCVDLRDAVLVPNAGHWTQQEAPAETNAALIKFLKGL